MLASPHKTPPTDLAVYVHWPFCTAICPYCDFNVYRDRGVDAALWKRAFDHDLAHAATFTPHHKVTSIFFGGGTPSLMPPGLISDVINKVDDLWGIVPGAEITLEANPSDRDHFVEFAAAGVNRLSLGVQSLRDDALKALGRWHDAAEAITAYKKARGVFNNVSLDLIYARPGQEEAEWEDELGETLRLELDHLSLYQLTIEPGTAFERAVGRGAIVPLADDPAALLYERAQEICEKAGLPAYEVSNHACADAQSVHNLTYWRYGDYMGVGPGAHGRFYYEGKRWATQAIKKPKDYLAHIEAKGHGLAEKTILSSEAQADEMMLLGLRLVEGVPLQRYEALAGEQVNQERLQFLIEAGLLQCDGDRLSATRQGRAVLNTVLAEILS